MTSATSRLPAFEHLIQELRKVWVAVSDIETRMKRAESLLKVALAESTIIAHSKQWPWTPGQNLLLYEDSDHHFVINATVRKPGSKGAVHDHGHSWTLYGLVEGTSGSSDTRVSTMASAPVMPSSSLLPIGKWARGASIRAALRGACRARRAGAFGGHHCAQRAHGRALQAAHVRYGQEHRRRSMGPGASSLRIGIVDRPP